MHRQNERGFTLIELLVVIAIIGVLSSVVIASLNTARGNARDTKRKSDMQSVVKAIALYRNDNPTYPPHGPVGASGSCGNATCLSVLENDLVPQYISEIPYDPTDGNTATGYRYCRATGGNEYQLMFYRENNTWCTVRGPAPISGTACWSSNGAPLPAYPYC